MPTYVMWIITILVMVIVSLFEVVLRFSILIQKIRKKNNKSCLFHSYQVIFEKFYTKTIFCYKINVTLYVLLILILINKSLSEIWLFYIVSWIIIVLKIIDMLAEIILKSILIKFIIFILSMCFLFTLAVTILIQSIKLI